MSAIQLTVTDAGRAALVNAAHTGTAPVTIAACGITATAFAAAAATTALPGEFLRLATLSGQVVDADTIHLIVRDAGTGVYSMRGFGLYLGDGTLFAAYGQAASIVDKAASSTMLLALDVRFADIAAASLTFGNTDFLDPPATTDVLGIVELATPAETIAATDGTRAVTPLGLGGAIDARFGPGAASGFVKTLLTAASAAAFRVLLGLKSAAGFDTGSGNGLDADTVDGFHAYNSGVGGPWPRLATVGSDGVMEVGRYVDFHLTENDPADNAVRVTATPGGLQIGSGTVWHSSNDGAGSGLDADLLAGLHETSFLRARPDAGQIVAAAIDAARPAGVYAYAQPGFTTTVLDIGGIGGSAPRFQVQFTYGEGLSFRVARDTDTNFDGGGFVPIWNASNDGSGSGLDADVVRGAAPSVGAAPSTLALRSDAGYLYASYFIAGSAANENPAVDQVIVTNADQTALRKIGLASFARQLVSAGQVWTAVNDGAGSGLDADLIDGIDSSAFLRRDTGGTWTLAAATVGTGYQFASLVLRETNFGGVQGSMAGAAPALTFLWGGVVATQLRMAADGALEVRDNPGTGFASLRVGTLTSFGQTVWNAGNDGAGSGLDADLVRGVAPSAPATGGTLVQRDGAGHVYGQYFNTQAAVNENPAVDQVIVTAPADGFLRRAGIGYFAGRVVAAAGIWTSANDGSGSGLDADLLDGRDSSSFANAADLAPALTDKAFGTSGWQRLPGGLLLMWGQDRAFRNFEGSFNVAFPEEFAGPPFMISVTSINSSSSNNRDTAIQVVSRSNAGFVAYCQNNGGGGANSDGFDWFAIGQ
ncbi:MAG: hypothetical protein JO290_12520 [Sphingomonadaceae bacterium]|nr:hypothetical protein [Sphingomonadaceae bacterium]